MPPIPSLEDLQELYGELDEESRERFTRFISKEKWDLDTIQSWLDEAVSNPRRFQKEFQDLVTSLGNRLGFSKVDFGSYSSVSGRISYDGLWENDTLRIVIEVKLEPKFANVDQLGRYIDELSEERGDGKPTYGIFVTGKTEPRDLDPLLNQLRGNRKYADRIRVISYSHLLRLAKIAEKNHLRNDQVSKILIPFDDANVGNLVEIIETIMEEERVASETPQLGEGKEERPSPIEVPKVPRASLSDLEEGDVVIYPSKPEGVEFLKQYQAWPARIGEWKNPKYFALYISNPDHAIKYFGEIEDLINTEDSGIENPEDRKYLIGKKVIRLKKGSLRELSDPIRKGASVPYVAWRVPLSKFINANITDDLLSRCSSHI